MAFLAGVLASRAPLLLARNPFALARRPVRVSTAAMGSEAPHLSERRCQACEGGLPVIPEDQARKLVEAIPAWTLHCPAGGPWQLSRRWRARNFASALAMCNKIGEVAESEGHHPDLHLTGYNMLRVDLSTHAVGGLSENDFILAAKIDCLSFEGLLSKKPQPQGIE